MGYTTPRTWVAAETVDEDHLNEQIRDNTVYLKTEVDKLDDVSQTQPARVIDTIYQNGTKIRLVAVTLLIDDNDTALAEVGSGTPPSTLVATFYLTATGGGTMISAFFVVLPNYYYRIRNTGASPTISTWTEWDLH